MATVNSTIYNVVNAAARQAYGIDVPAVKDSTGLIQLRDIVFSSTANKDAWYGALSDVIYRTRFMQARRDARERFLLDNNMDWSTYIRIVKLATIQTASEDPAFDSTTQASPFDVESKEKGNIIQKIFGGNLNPYTFETSYPIDQMFTSFDGEEQMGGFIALIYQRMEQEYQTAKENLNKLAINSAAAYVYQNGSAAQKVHLVTEYNDFRGVELTKDQIYADKDVFQDYLAFAAAKIVETIGDMDEMRVDFNCTANEDLKYATATSRDEVVVEAIYKFIQNVGSFAKSKFFHDEFIELPMHTTVNAWDAMDASHSYASRCKIQVSNEALITEENTEGEVTINNLVMMIRSKNAVASIIDKPQQWSQVNMRARVVNHGESANKAMYFDASENFVLILED